MIKRFLTAGLDADQRPHPTMNNTTLTHSWPARVCKTSASCRSRYEQIHTFPFQKHQVIHQQYFSLSLVTKIPHCERKKKTKQNNKWLDQPQCLLPRNITVNNKVRLKRERSSKRRQVQQVIQQWLTATRTAGGSGRFLFTSYCLEYCSPPKQRETQYCRIQYSRQKKHKPCTTATSVHHVGRIRSARTNGCLTPDGWWALSG